MHDINLKSLNTQMNPVSIWGKIFKFLESKVQDKHSVTCIVGMVMGACYDHGKVKPCASVSGITLFLNSKT